MKRIIWWSVEQGQRCPDVSQTRAGTHPSFYKQTYGQQGPKIRLRPSWVPSSLSPGLPPRFIRPKKIPEGHQGSWDTQKALCQQRLSLCQQWDKHQTWPQDPWLQEPGAAHIRCVALGRSPSPLMPSLPICTTQIKVTLTASASSCLSLTCRKSQLCHFCDLSYSKPHFCHL